MAFKWTKMNYKKSLKRKTTPNQNPHNTFLWCVLVNESPFDTCSSVCHSTNRYQTNFHLLYVSFWYVSSRGPFEQNLLSNSYKCIAWLRESLTGDALNCWLFWKIFHINHNRTLNSYHWVVEKWLSLTFKLMLLQKKGLTALTYAFS